jgi:hypothetical protein
LVVFIFVVTRVLTLSLSLQAFLKHASPVAKKAGQAPKRTPSQDGDMGSMPSLTSSEESPNDSKADEVPSQKFKPVSSTTLEPNTAEKTAVNALLMAAVAMTEMSSHAAPATTEVPLVSTPPDRRTETVAPMEEEDCKTPQKNLLRQFQSPKRKQADTESPGEHKEQNSVTPKMSQAKMRSQPNNGGSSTESSPTGSGTGTGEEDNDDSPKRDNSELTDMTPSLQQKSKRSRIGSVRKGPSRNLGQEMAHDQPSPMVMQTPKQAKSTVTNDLTPVSARCIDFKRMHVGKGSPERTGQ